MSIYLTQINYLDIILFMARVKKTKNDPEQGISENIGNVESPIEKKENLFSKVYQGSAFADPGRRPRVILASIIVIVFVIVVAFLFSIYNYGIYYPGISKVIDKIPILNHLDRSPQNIFPKVISAEDSISSYSFTGNMDYSAGGGLSTQDSFNGQENIANKNSVQVSADFSHKVVSSNTSLLMTWKSLQSGSKIFLNFSQVPSILNSGIKTGEWIKVGNAVSNPWNFLLDQSQILSSSSSNIKDDGNSIVNGTPVTEYTITIPLSNLNNVNLVRAFEQSYGPISTVGSSGDIKLNEWIGIADNRIYQESTIFKLGTNSSSTFTLQAAMSQFNSKFAIALPKKFVSLGSPSAG